jgi:hypothetical protein
MNTKQLNDLKDLVKIQGRDGNWNYSEYMRGMFNGMELALAMAEKREPNLRDEPKRYICNASTK